MELTVSPIFLLTAPERNPRTECGCQPVAFISSFKLAPPDRFSSSKTLAEAAQEDQHSRTEAPCRARQGVRRVKKATPAKKGHKAPESRQTGKGGDSRPRGQQDRHPATGAVT